MKFASIIVMAFAIGFSTVGCLSTETTTAVLSKIETVVDATLPIVAQMGVVAAQSYVNQQVSDGTITSEQATLINTAISNVATSISISKSKDMENIWLKPETKNIIMEQIKAGI